MMGQSHASVRPHAAGEPGQAHTGGRSVLAGAFKLLAAVQRTGGAGLTRLSSESGIPKATAYRLLEQLAELGAVERYAREYRIGSRMFQLGGEWQPHPALNAAAAEPVRSLAALTGAAVGIAVLRQDRTLLLDWAPGRTAFPIARHQPEWPWYTAAGKVLAAAPGYRFPLSAVPARWPREAQAIRERGVAVDREILLPGLSCTAAPLYGTDGAPVAAVFAATRLTDRQERLADVVLRAGRAISAGLARTRI